MKRDKVIKCLSLDQPWATLMALGEKKIETRSWATQYRGLLAIHSCKTFKNEYLGLLNEKPFKMVFDDYGLGFDDLPLGKILCVVNLNFIWTTSYLKEQGNVPLLDRYFGDYSDGRYGWVTGGCVPLKEPIPARGYQNLWVPEDDVYQKIMEQIDV